MEAKIHVMFTKIGKEEWREFSSLCRKNGTTMTKVLMRAIKEYMKGGKEK